MKVSMRMAALTIAARVLVAQAGELPGFSFDYQITGDRSIAPFQVFDDGASIFLQFRDPNRVPAVFVRDAAGSRIATAEAHGNYLRISGLAPRLELVSDRKTATVISMRKVASVPAPAMPQTAFLPQGERKSELPPTADADVRKQVETLRRSVDALSDRVNAIVAAATAGGPSKTSVPVAAPATNATGDRNVLVFEVEPGQRLSEAVRRFVATQRLELDWDTGGADYEIRFGFRVVGGSLDEVLFGVLGPFKLNAVTRLGNRVVAVSRAA